MKIYLHGIGLSERFRILNCYSASEICFRLEADIDGIGIQTVGWTIK